jgi:glycerophosphoryl diester phosphodiesterase
MTLVPLKDYPFNEKPMICAHRGDTSHGAIENSISAIEAAISSGVEMIEMDVQMTSDGVLICHHDETLEKDDAPIWKRSYSDLLLKSNEDLLPKFEDILRHAAGKVYLNIEMKDYSGFHPSRFVHPLVGLVKEFRMHEYSLYSSFRFDFIQALPWDSLSVIIRPTTSVTEFFNKRSLSPVFTSRPIEQMPPSEVVQFAHATSYACMLNELTDEFRKDILKQNIFLSVYTARTIEDFKLATAAGAKAIVTDIPEELLSYRRSISKK